MLVVYKLIKAAEFTTCKNFTSVIGLTVIGFNVTYHWSILRDDGIIIPKYVGVKSKHNVIYTASAFSW